MTGYDRGDVILVDFPNSDHKTYKKRPALIIQDESIETKLSQRIIVQITSNPKRTGITRVPVQKDSAEGKQMGLRTDSIIVTDNIETIKPFMIEKIIGRCPLMPQVGMALRLTLGLN